MTKCTLYLDLLGPLERDDKYYIREYAVSFAGHTGGTTFIRKSKAKKSVRKYSASVLSSNNDFNFLSISYQFWKGTSIL